jgi:rhamnosyl/mannosyltransferase
MKVWQISKLYPPVVGGVENHLAVLANGLKDRAETKVLVANTTLRTEIEKRGNLEVIRLGSLGKLFSLPLSFLFPVWFRRLDGDILHFHLPCPLAVISYLCVRPKGKVVVTYHSDIVRQRLVKFFYRPFLMGFLKRADAIITSSPNLRDNSFVLKKFRKKCHLIPFGIDVERFKLTPEIAKKAHRIREAYGEALILFVGRLVSYKGLKYLLGALTELDARLLIIGRGPLEAKLKRLAKRLDVEGKIIWLGELVGEDLVAHYYASQALVLPSIANSEALGIVQMEAFSCGRPVVSTDLPTGVPFINLHRKTGLIVPPRDAGALAEAIGKLLEAPALCKRYGHYARERMKEEFSKELMIERIDRLYYDLLGEGNDEKS